MRRISFLSLTILACSFIAATVSAQRSEFVTVKGHRLERGGKSYYFVGANYWYGSLLGLEKDPKRGVERLRHELDTLKANGVSNLRVLGGAEGTGVLNGVTRVGPALQPAQGKFDRKVLYGLDILLAEMAKRDMTAVIYLSNNWEWSGGFQQYLIWNKKIDSGLLTRKPEWDELRDAVARFYTCDACIMAYRAQVRMIVGHRNSVTGKRYIDDPTIMAWELANEPRPMRPASNDAYLKWIGDSAALIKELDRRHLVTTGHEGHIGTESFDVFRKSHAFADISYLTIHIWPKNWGWLTGATLAASLPNAIGESQRYIDEDLKAAIELDKPLVIEEFGLPRDDGKFSTDSSTSLRDRYYTSILSRVGSQKDSADSSEYIAGANFWAFGGSARPVAGQPFWKAGDDRMGDPPMEEQGLNTVFDSDRSTLDVIEHTADAIASRR